MSNAVVRLGTLRAKTARLLKETQDKTDDAIRDKQPEKAQRLIELAKELHAIHGRLTDLIKSDDSDDDE